MKKRIFLYFICFISSIMIVSCKSKAAILEGNASNTLTSDKLIIHNNSKGTEGLTARESLIYGEFHDDPSNQIIRFNSQVEFTQILPAIDKTYLLYWDSSDGKIQYKKNISTMRFYKDYCLYDNKLQVDIEKLGIDLNSFDIGISTGYGRNNTDLNGFNAINEIKAHAYGAMHQSEEKNLILLDRYGSKLFSFLK